LSASVPPSDEPFIPAVIPKGVRSLTLRFIPSEYTEGLPGW
jgi:hypothetical protein